MHYRLQIRADVQHCVRCGVLFIHPGWKTGILFISNFAIHFVLGIHLHLFPFYTFSVRIFILRLHLVSPRYAVARHSICYCYCDTYTPFDILTA